MSGITDINMPQLGETVTEGTVTKWHKHVGDHVLADDVLFEVVTDKVETEVPSPVEGFVAALLVDEGATVPIGTRLAVITATAEEAADLPTVPTDPTAGPASVGAAAEPTARVRATERASERTARRPRPGPRPARPGRHPAEPPRPFLSPAVRQLLARHGLDPADVDGTGRDGRITAADVEAAAAEARPTSRTSRTTPASPASPAIVRPIPTELEDDDVVEPFNAIRKATAEHMMRSLATSAHTLVVAEVDYHAVDAARHAAPTKLSYLPFVARAVVDGIGRFPRVNAVVGDGSLIVKGHVHLGIAVDLDFEGLVVPVLHDAADLRLPALAERLHDLASRAHAKRLKPDDVAGGTFTITNAGGFGTFVTAPIINQPQVAILSTDGVRMRPVAVATGEGEWAVAVHPVGNLALSFDHRAIDGAYASAFLAAVRDTIEQRDWAAEVTR